MASEELPSCSAGNPWIECAAPFGIALLLAPPLIALLLLLLLLTLLPLLALLLLLLVVTLLPLAARTLGLRKAPLESLSVIWTSRSWRGGQRRETRQDRKCTECEEH